MTCDLAFSVVIPAHGRLALLAATVDSVAEQSLDSFELVVSDDSAEAHEREAVCALVQDYRSRTGRPAQYLHTEPSMGLARNANQGLRAVRGRYVRLLDSDDLLAPLALHRELAVLTDPSVGVDVVLQLPLGFSSAAPQWGEPSLALVDPGSYIRERLAYQTPTTSCVTVARELLEKVGPLDECLGHLTDWDLVSRLLRHEHGRRRLVAFLTPALVGYRHHLASMTAKGWRRHFLEHAASTRRLAKQSRHDPGLWVGAEPREFRARATRYRYRRLHDELEALDRDELCRQWRSLRSVAFSPDALAQLPDLAVRTLHGIPALLRTQRQAAAAEAPAEDPIEEGVVDIVPDVWVHDDPSMRGARLCLPFDRPLGLDRQRLLADSRLVRCWHPGARGARRAVLRDVARFVPVGAVLDVVGWGEPGAWPALVEDDLRRVAAAHFATMPSQVRRDGLASARFRRTVAA